MTPDERFPSLAEEMPLTISILRIWSVESVFRSMPLFMPSRSLYSSVDNPGIEARKPSLS